MITGITKSAARFPSCVNFFCSDRTGVEKLFGLLCIPKRIYLSKNQPLMCHFKVRLPCDLTSFDESDLDK